MNDDESRELYMEYRALTEQLQKIEEYLGQTAEHTAEIGNVLGALDELKAAKSGSRMLAPVANGIFVEATLGDPLMVRMNVGSGVVVEKSVDDAKTLIEGQRKDLAELRDRATGDRETLMNRMREIETAIESSQTEAPAPAKPHTHHHK